MDKQNPTDDDLKMAMRHASQKLFCTGTQCVSILLSAMTTFLAAAATWYWWHQ